MEMGLPLRSQQPENPPMTFDESSMDRSKSFVKALQELKNLRPQLYSAAEYCEKSYLHSEQKQMVLDNLKDYAVRALVNAVDHLGTVAYKLTDLLEQQTLDISTMELKFVCLNQQLLTSRTYTDKEGLRQQQLLAFIPRHHKHYIVPNFVNKKVHFSSFVHTEPRQSYIQAKPRFDPSDHPASKTLSWHLASDTNPTIKGSPRAPIMSSEDAKESFKNAETFHLLDAEDSPRAKSSAAHLHLQSGVPAARVAKQNFGVTQKEMTGCTKPLTTLKSLGPHRHDIARTPVRTKSMLSSFFVKQKTRKLKGGPFS